MMSTEGRMGSENERPRLRGWPSTLVDKAVWIRPCHGTEQRTVLAPPSEQSGPVSWRERSRACTELRKRAEAFKARNSQTVECRA